MEIKEQIKLALISGASHALKYKEQNPRATDEEAIQHVSRQLDSIMHKIGKSE
jgi:hypothetical protein